MIDLIQANYLAAFAIIGLGAAVFTFVLCLLWNATHEPRVYCDPSLDHSRGQPDELWLPTSKEDCK